MFYVVYIISDNSFEHYLPYKVERNTNIVGQCVDVGDPRSLAPEASASLRLTMIVSTGILPVLVCGIVLQQWRQAVSSQSHHRLAGPALHRPREQRCSRAIQAPHRRHLAEQEEEAQSQPLAAVGQSSSWSWGRRSPGLATSSG